MIDLQYPFQFNVNSCLLLTLSFRSDLEVFIFFDSTCWYVPASLADFIDSQEFVEVWALTVWVSADGQSKLECVEGNSACYISNSHFI